MPEYWTCPYCGAALDPGEKCDCRNNQQAEPDEIELTGSLKDIAAEIEAAAH